MGYETSKAKTRDDDSDDPYAINYVRTRRGHVRLRVSSQFSTAS